MPDIDTAVKTRAPVKKENPYSRLKTKTDAREAELLAEIEALKGGNIADEQEDPSRARSKAERRKRRARGSNDLSHQMKLGVGFDLDKEFEYRWINGGLDDQRLHDKTQTDKQGADWTPLTSEGVEAAGSDERSDSTGSVLRRAVGLNQAGQTEYAYLCRKPRDLYEEDHALIQRVNDKRMQAIQDGKATAPDGSSADNDGLGYKQEVQISGQGRKAIKI